MSGEPIPYELGILRISTKDLQIIEIDGVKYSKELFDAFAAPDPTRLYQFARDGTVTEVVGLCEASTHLRQLIYAARKARDWMHGASSMHFGEWIDPVMSEMLEVSLENYRGIEGLIPSVARPRSRGD